MRKFWLALSFLLSIAPARAQQIPLIPGPVDMGTMTGVLNQVIQQTNALTATGSLAAKTNGSNVVLPDFRNALGLGTANSPTFAGINLAPTANSLGLGVSVTQTGAGDSSTANCNSVFAFNCLVNTDATSGVTGHVTVNLGVIDIVPAGSDEEKWTLFSRMVNSGTLSDGTRVAFYSQAQKLSTGLTFAGTMELQNTSFGVTDAGAVTLELDHDANSTDPGQNRSILDLVAYNLAAPLGTGVKPTIDYGIRIQSQGNSSTTAQFGTGILFGATNFITGIDMHSAAGYSTAALWFPSDTGILWDTAGAHSQTWGSSDSCMHFNVVSGAAIKQELCADGKIIATDGTVIMKSVPLTASGIGEEGTFSAHDYTIYAGGSEQARFLSHGGVQLSPINGTSVMASIAGEFGAEKIAATNAAPGAGYMKFNVVTGTNAGSCKLIAYAGTSGTPVTVVDNVGAGC